MLKYFISIVFLGGLLNALTAQSYIADTIYVKFQYDSVITINNSTSVSDKRDIQSNFVSVYEKKKWLFFPVDQVVLTNKDLASGFKEYLQTANASQYHINIHQFNIDYKRGMFKHSLNLNASFELYGSNSTKNNALLGVFYYDMHSSNKRKIAVTEAYSTAISNFNSEFVWDLNAVCSDTTSHWEAGKNHYRKGQGIVSKNLFISSDIYYGLGFWGFDAEIYFAAPEPAQKFKQKSRMFRYMNFENRQSAAFSSGVSYLNYRLNNNYLFQNKSAFLLGFNKWNDVDEKKRTLEEIFLFQFSMMQRLSFNTLDKSGFVFGVGVMEEVSYVIYNKPMFNIALLLHCSYKF